MFILVLNSTHLLHTFFSFNQKLSYKTFTFVASEASLEIFSSYLSFYFYLNEVSLALAKFEIFFSK